MHVLLTNAFLGTNFGLYIGRVGLLVATIIIIRVLPDGISGLIDRWRMRPGAGR